MTSLLCILYGLSLLAVGLCVVRFLVPLTSSPLEPLHMAFATGAAAVLNAALTFLRIWTAYFPVSFQLYAVCAAGLLCTWIVVRTRRWPEGNLPVSSERPSPFLRFLFWGTCLGGAILFFLQCLGGRHGGIDAWMHWNLKARFLAHGARAWARFLEANLSFTHPDYPLLLPLNVSSFYAVLKADPCTPGIAVAAAFGLSVVILVARSGQLLAQRGAFAAAMLLLTPTFLTTCTKQYADIEISYFFLATCLCLHLAFTTKRAGALLLAGIFAGGAAATKNEGFAFLGCLCPAVLLTSRSVAEGRLGKTLWLCVPFAAGSCLSLWHTLAFKFLHAPLPAAIEGSAAATFGLASDWLSRVADASWQLFKFLLRPTAYAWIPLALAPVSLWCLAGRGLRCLPLRWIAAFGLPLFLTALAYLAVYLTVQGVSVHWLIRATIRRLFLHLWPAGIVAACALLSCGETHRGATLPVRD